MIGFFFQQCKDNTNFSHFQILLCQCIIINVNKSWEKLFQAVVFERLAVDCYDG